MKFASNYILLTIYIMVFILSKSYSQKESYNWYFGDHAGLNFSNGTPITLPNGQLNCIEGVASISDHNGELLFYSNGITIWNKDHQIMLNGSGLFGHQSSTQSGIIVPNPLVDSLYYVFTVDASAGGNGLCYSIINMQHDNSRGEVIQKNIQLISPSCEKVTAVRHCNNRDIWVITRLWNSDSYYCYLVSANGINPTPVISNTGYWVGDPGLINAGAEAQGYLKVSPNGKKLAAAHTRFDDIELLDFNNSTGVLGNLKRIPTFNPSIYYKNNYGIEFSPNNRLMYISASGQNFFGDPNLYSLLLQFDLSVNNENIITQSRFVVDSNATQPYRQRGAIQIGPDGKLYSPRSFYNYLDRVNDPNQIGIACNFEQNAVDLGTTSQGILGLPNFIQSYFKSHINVVGNCTSQTLNFSLSDITGIDSVKWSFGDILSGSSNFSNLFSTTHAYSTVGIYQVQVILYNNDGCAPDTLIKSINAGALTANLGADNYVCQGDTLRLHVNGQGANILWNTGSQDSILYITSAGTYWVSISIDECTIYDTINIITKNAPVFTLGNDTSICTNASILLGPMPPLINCNYLWNTNALSSTITTNNIGSYWLCATDNFGCKWRDTIQVLQKVLPNFTLGPTLNICQGNIAILNATVPGASGYLWNNGTSLPTLETSIAGLYWCEVTKDACSYRDSVEVFIKPKPTVNLGSDTTLCEGTMINLTATNASATYLWQDGSNNSLYVVGNPGQYSVTVNLDGCTLSDTINVNYRNKPIFTLGQDQFICSGQTIILKPVLENGLALLWQDGNNREYFTVTQPGLYSLQATNTCGSTTDEIKIYEGICDIYVPTAFTPNNDGLNDLFKVKGTELVSDFDFQIYNRYGQKIFFTKDKSKGWDGANSSIGSYTWILRYKKINESKYHELKGSVLLIN